jgi:anti-sigma B factor antagonist
MGAKEEGVFMQLTINTRDVQGAKVLDLSGRIVAGDEVDAVRTTIKDLLAAGQKKIVLNMGEVQRIDSTGIGMLVESMILSAKEDAQLKMYNLPRLIYNVLHTHRLLQAFEIYKTEDEAMASFAKAAQQLSG